ncbi:YceI family protein [Altericroceibacterium xinjiangense]|uniref:YceI family protein n=1 Tax=Altericroceibacterium xinjiangense TaxID=762261 RepID=UPI000F7EEC6F|nr:YceI family protein [Altericroceibacterium xinjiangense]
MRKWTLSLAAAGAALVSVGALQAQTAPQLPGTMDATRVTAGTYTVDPGHTLVGWRVNHFGFNDYFGIFGNVEGNLAIDPANPGAAKLDVTIPISSLVVASQGLRDHLLRPGADGKTPDFFGAEPQPARFVSTQVTRNGPTTADITGNLTLNGVTKPVTIAARFTGAGANPMSQVATVGFEGTTTINRTDYGINFAAPFVSDAVELDISAAFEKR